MRRSWMIAWAVLGCGLGWGADWLTDAYDSQRTNWQRDENVLSTATAKDIKLLWKIKLDNQPRQMHNLFPPLIIEKVNTARGPRQLAIEAGVSDNLYGIDVEKGEVIWKKHFASSYTPPPSNGRRGDILCPGGLTATPV